MSHTRCLLLCSNNSSAKIIYNYLKSNVEFVSIVIENPISLKNKVRFRVKKLGVLTTIGQLIFIVLSKILKKINRERIDEILTENKMNDSAFDQNMIVNVDSVNSTAVKEFIMESTVDIVLVAGTRIISRSVIDCTKAPFINIHAGITPKYRGVHGGYWALVNNDLAHCGATIHIVDKGVDTGTILAQSFISPDKKDNFSTYPLLQLASALPILKQLLNKDVSQIVKMPNKIIPDSISKQWYHPTIWLYLYHRIVNGVK